ncbi:sce7725 family protein [Tenacibaculum sp. 190524A02b]|uniref:sce7725 family protein n=1 Tax=Tenacibaculum vairaonense TaxID=3137860 RepID=UPI0031FAE6F5
MYFPFLRGKQFELIALREIAPVISRYNYISPIIEPVKRNASTFSKTLGMLIKENINFSIVINPHVGDVQQDMDYVFENFINPITSSYNNFHMGIIVTQNTNINSIEEKLKVHSAEKLSINLIIGSVDESQINNLVNFVNIYNVNFIVLGTQVRKRRNVVRKFRGTKAKLITVSDPFIKQTRNKDYLIKEDEFFSEEHVFYSDEGYVGFSDFLTIGNDYSDKGYSPYAVAIHLTYPTGDNSFRIRHFVSDSNDDPSDIAGKFEEALEKLILFVNEKSLNTSAVKQFKKLYDEQKYPGLGSVKKLSVLHHIELVNNYFIM